MYRLRAMLASDCDLVLQWRNQPNVRDNMYTNHVIEPDEHRRWFGVASVDPTVRLMLCVDQDEVPVGLVTFSDIRPQQKSATWAFYSGRSDRRGVGSEMEFLALDFAFGELGLEKLNCEVLGFNMPVVEFHRKHGFRVEGIFRKHYERDGERHDVYRLAHFRKAWLEQVRPAMLREREAGRSRLRPGAVYRERMIISRERVERFAAASGDANSIHVDDSAAKAAGLPGAVVHGALLAAEFSRILGTQFPGPGTIYVSQSLLFLEPVLPDTQIECVLRVASRIGKRAILITKVLGAEDRPLVTGEAEVVVPEEKST